MTSVRRALALSMMERYLLIALALVSNMLIARLLTPAEIGLYSVTLAVVSLAHMVRDFGIGSFLIQHTDLQERHIRTAFGVMLIIGVSLFTGFFFGSSWAASFYSDPRVGEALRICALNFLVLPFCAISMSLMRREMRFDRIAILSLTGGVVGAATTLSLAWAGMGPNALAVGSVATNVSVGMVAWWMRRDPALFRPTLTEWREVLGFGIQSALTNVVSSATTDVNDLVLAKVLGFAPVAMISRAQGLMNMFQRDLMGAVSGVAFPAFARVHREGGSVEPKWVAAVGAITVFAWPFYGFLSLMPMEVVRLMFGDQWDTAARLVPIFCGAGAVLALSNLVLLHLLSVGRMDMVTRFELTFQPLRAGAIIAVAVITESLLACAWAFLVTAALQALLTFWVKTRCMTVDWRALGAQLRASLLVTAITLLAPFLASVYYGTDRTHPLPLALFLACVAIGTLSWLGGLMWVRHPITGDPMFIKVMEKLRLRK